MSSSVKYKKFAISEGDDEKKSHESRKKSKFLAIVLVFVAIASVTISVTAVAIAIGVGVGVSTESGHSTDANGLTVTVITREQLQGGVPWLSWRHPFPDYSKQFPCLFVCHHRKWRASC